jgi:nitrile hydratase accessory protein
MAKPGLLPPQPHDDEGPVFAEPWHAQAFALAVQLSEQGLFTWAEWTETIAVEIKAAGAAGDPDLGDTYYGHWLSALERLVQEKGAADPQALDERKEAWRRAYLHTPHGQAVELSAGQYHHD